MYGKRERMQVSSMYSWGYIVCVLSCAGVTAFSSDVGPFGWVQHRVVLMQ